MKSVRIAATGIILSSLLAGCGGGGDSSSPVASSVQSGIPTATSIDESNYQPAVATAAYATSIVTSANSNGAIATGVLVQSRPVGIVDPIMALVGLASHHLPASATGVAVNQSTACQTSGSITLAGNVADQTKLSTGDAVTLTANNCTQNGSTLNGVFSFSVNSISGDPSSTGAAKIDISLSFSDLGVTTQTTSSEVVEVVNGDLRVGLDQVDASHKTYTLAGDSLNGKRTENGTMVANLTVASFSGTEIVDGTNLTDRFDYAVFGNNARLGNFSYVVKTPQAFQSINDGTYPYAGSLVVTGASSTVTLTAISNAQVRLDFSPNGDGVVTKTITETWAEFEASV